MSSRTKRRYGLPFKGYKSSVPPHMAEPEYATSDGPSSSRRSVNYRFSPLEGKFFRKAGQAIVGSSTGILENGTGELTTARVRQMLSLKSSSMTAGYPSHASLWTEEDNNKGCLHFYETNTPADHVLGQEFGTTQYPSAAGTASLMKAMPYMRTTDGTIGRFNTLALRAIAAVGSRRLLEVGDWLFAPNKEGTPWRWDKKFNDTNADTDDIWRVMHTGRPSPLGLPTITTGTINTAGQWHEGDEFYISVAFKFADGSVSMPIIPRDRNDEVNLALNSNHTGFGKISLARSGAPADDRYLYLTWTTIPIGPSDCVGRYLLRTPKLNGATDGAGAATQEGTVPSPLDLRICAYIPNNTQTSYQDPNGNDLALLDDPLLVRIDHIMQPPARTIGTCDGRVIVGYTKPHPVAIYIAPRLNVSDNDSTIDDMIYRYTLTGGTLTLTEDDGTPASITIANIGSMTIQQLVDSINNTTGSAGSGGKWFACVAPGADAAALCDDLGTAADNDNLTDVTAGVETGDTSGTIRAFGSSWPAPIFWSTTYLANFPAAPRRWFFTMGGPGMPPMAANSYAAGNFRDAPETWGQAVGSGALNGGAVLCHAKAIGLLQNRRAGVSGEDADYRIWELNPGRGCIAPGTIVEHNGVVGYLTIDGFVFTDGRDEVVVSGDVWSAATRTGEWAYEIDKCAAGAAADNDLAKAHAKIMGGKLYVFYRLTSSSTWPGHYIVYDFTASAQFSGLRGVLRPDGTPWGWSTPQAVPGACGAAVEVTNASGINRYTADEGSYVGQTSDGRINQIETGTQDDGGNFTSDLWTARDFVDALKKKSMQEATLLYKKSATGLSLNAYRDSLGTTASATITLAASGTNFSKKVLPLAQAARTPADAVEFRIRDDGTSSAPEVWGMEVDMVLTDSYG